MEMFQGKNGQVYVNELAPRPHNSGHYTLDACKTSQFEQFIRAVTGQTLQPPHLLSPALMVNVLGEHVEAFMEKFFDFREEVSVHWYGKAEVRTGRKMAHCTFCAKDLKTTLEKVEQLQIWESLTHEEREQLELAVTHTT
jgi:5-(carboxyamino)imidazole ribonucleotide synthase